MVMLQMDQAKKRKSKLEEAMSPKLQAAIEGGELTVEELRELIALEAKELGLTVEEAQREARLGRLPKNAVGSDVEFPLQLLAA